MLGVAGLTEPGQHEDTLLADHRQPVGEPRSGCRCHLACHESPGELEQAERHQLSHRVDEPGAAQALRLFVSDDLQHEVVRGHLHRLDRPLGGPHPTTDRGALERRSGRGRRGEKALARAEHDLAIRTDVDKEPGPPVAVHAGREQPGRDVSADVGTECREHCGSSPRVGRYAEVGSEQVAEGPARHHEGRHAERLGVDAERDVGHRRVAGERDFVDLPRSHARLLTDGKSQLGERLVCSRAEPVERAVVQHDARDAGYDVGAERLLPVEHRVHSQGRAAREVEQGGDHRRRTEVVRDREQPLGRVAGLDVYEHIVDDHGSGLVPRFAQHRADRAQGVQVDPELEVVKLGQQALEVGRLVRQRGLLQLDEPLLHGRAEDDLASDADGRRLRAGDEGRHLHLEVAHGFEPTGEPPALAQLVALERPRVERRHRGGAVEHPHLALLAGAVPTAGRVDGDAVPASGVEEGHPRRDAHLPAARLEAEVNALAAVLFGAFGHGVAAVLAL